MIKKVVNKEYNQFKEQLDEKMWNELNPAIDELNKDISKDLSIFTPKVE